MSLYEDLGVDRAALRDSIKKAFRRKAMRAHPDRGGKPEEFRKIERAYSVLYDPSRRARYDQDGREDAAPEQNQDLLLLAQVIMSVIEQINPENSDLISIARDILLSKQNEIRQAIVKLRLQEKKYRQAMQRLTRKKEGVDYIRQMLDARVAQIEADILRADQNVETGERILTLLKDYSYRVDPYSCASVSIGFASMCQR